MDIVDVLNENGKPTGHTASITEVHERGFWHRAAHTSVINSKNEILVQLRAKTVINHPGEYDISTAGHLETGETPIQGVLREFKEELGKKLKEEDLVHIGEVSQEEHRTGYIDKEWNDVFVVHKDIKINEFTIDPNEVELVKYISLNEFKEWVKNPKEHKLVEHPKKFDLLLRYIDTKT